MTTDDLTVPAVSSPAQSSPAQSSLTRSSPTGGGAAERSPRLLPGEQIDGWVVESHLGAGAQSELYVVRGLLDGVPRRLALKLVTVPAAPASADGLLREAYALTTFRHPHLLRAYCAWQVSGDNAVALLLPLAETTLAEHLRGGEPAADTSLHAEYRGAAGLAEALAYLHRSRKSDGSRVVLHNDIKPENVLQVDGRWMLSDFGIASAPGPEAAGGGTLSFLAPEYLTEPPTGKHAPGDVWALGILLHRWLSGRYPFPGVTPWERAAAVRRGDEPALAVAETPARELIATMLARVPEDRPGAAPVARRLRALGDDRSGSAGAGPGATTAVGPDQTRPWRKRLTSRPAVAAAALLLGLSAGWSGYAVLAPARTHAVTLPSYGVARGLRPGQQVPIRSQPGSSAQVTTLMPDGAPAGIVCTVHGDVVQGNWGPTDLWDKVLYGKVTGWVSDGLLYTGTNAAVAPGC